MQNPTNRLILTLLFLGFLALMLAALCSPNTRYDDFDTQAGESGEVLP